MSYQRPDGPAPAPSPPDVPRTQPDPGRGLALAGFVCGLISVIAALLGVVFASGVLPDRTSGEGLLLLLAAFPLAFVGLVFSVAGRRSTSRRQLALAGLVLCLIPLVLLGLALLVVYLSWSRCAPHCI